MDSRHPHSPEPPQPLAVRRVTLPSGRTIEVLLFGEETDLDRDLHICPQCERDLVHPVDWSPASEGHWRVELHCPNCEWVEEGIFCEDLLERFDEALDAGTDVLIADLRRLARANMEDEVDRFAHALHADHIVPMDF